MNRVGNRLELTPEINQHIVVMRFLLWEITSFMTARRENDVSHLEHFLCSLAVKFPECEKNASFNSAFQSKFNLAKKLAISHLAALPKVAISRTRTRDGVDDS